MKLTLNDIVRLTGYSKHHVYFLSSTGSLPPPRSYGRRGEKQYAAEDIEFWRKSYHGKGPQRRGRKRRKS